MTIVNILCDLRNRFGPTRDQDQRPTCLAFATSDTHASLRSPWAALSVEFAFYHAQRRAGRSAHVGATLPAMLATLREDGQPVEEGWPYLLTVPADESDWRPRGDVGELYRRHGEKGGVTAEEIVQRLDQGRPVLMLLTLSRAFDLVDQSGIVDQLPGDEPDLNRRHAVIAVGHGLLRADRAILVRNSWGEDWGNGGYAWLTEAYLKPRIFRIGILTEDVDVPTRAVAA
jgi:Papain family cysteine protease